VEKEGGKGRWKRKVEKEGAQNFFVLNKYFFVVSVLF
jgi:stalled ribosome alternative rescue factor ArfA